MDETPVIRPSSASPVIAIAILAAVTERCPECGFEYRLEEFADAGPAIAAGSARIAAEMESQPGGLNRRLDPAVWSPLEYACHLRDVLLVQRERVLLARRRDRPNLEPMGRDERVKHDGYSTQDPVAVTRQLLDAAAMFAHALARLGPADWTRTVMYNYPSPAERSLQWVAVHTLHEVRHHHLDIQRQLPA
jgi:DinB superfamily